MHEGRASHLLPGLRTALATKIKGISGRSVTVETSACLPSLLTACTTYVQRMADERLLAGSLSCPVHCGNPVESDGEEDVQGFPGSSASPLSRTCCLSSLAARAVTRMTPCKRTCPASDLEMKIKGT